MNAWLADASRLDAAIYAAVARTSTPELDRTMRAISRAADHSRLSLACAALLALFGGPAGRRAAQMGVASVAVTSAAVNGVAKPLGPRARPHRGARRLPFVLHVPIARRVRMPASSSFPSGHAAAAFAFATGVGDTLPMVGGPLRALAALVAYSRVHTGVHYPGDVVAGALLGGTLAQLTATAFEHQRPRRRTRSSTAATATT